MNARRWRTEPREGGADLASAKALRRELQPRSRGLGCMEHWELGWRNKGEAEGGRTTQAAQALGQGHGEVQRGEADAADPEGPGCI